MTAIPGYDYGTAQVAHSPLSLADFELLKQAVMFGPDDERYLRMAGDVLADQIDDILDRWYGFVGLHPHLLYYFTDEQGHIQNEYLAAVRRRFGQWILDTCWDPTIRRG